MRKALARSLPSPAMVVALTALFVALGGTGYAATQLSQSPSAAAAKHKKKKNDNSADKKLIKKLIKNAAPTLSVASATNATNATNATTAASANSIGAVTYVQGNNVDVPANGGSGFNESGPSIATCPSGTVVVGSGAVTFAAGEEISELEIAVKAETGPPAVPANSVVAYIDNFTNTDQPNGNYAEAVCTAAKTVNNPSGLAARHH